MGKELLHGFIMITSDDLSQGALGSMFQGSFSSSFLANFLMETGGQGGDQQTDIPCPECHSVVLVCPLFLVSIN